MKSSVLSFVLFEVFKHVEFFMKEIKPFADILQNKRSWKFRKFHRQAPVLESLFNKVAGSRPVTLLKRGSNKSVSCEICEIFKNTFFKEPLRWLLFEY